jgi:hypothetical protein
LIHRYWELGKARTVAIVYTSRWEIAEGVNSE